MHRVPPARDLCRGIICVACDDEEERPKMELG